MGRKNRARKSTKEPAATPAGSGVQRNWVIGALLALTFLAFANTLANGFAYDDETQVLGNKVIRSLSNIPTALTKEVWFFRHLQDRNPNEESNKATTPYYRPVFTIYLMIGWQFFGDWTPGWHLFNVLMHMLAVFLAFLILEKITQSLSLSAIATLLFAVHPLRSESVAWVSGATDLLLAIFVLSACYFYMKYREARKKKHLVASLGLFLLAAFSKEPAVALAIFIPVYELFIVRGGTRLKERIKPALAYGAMFFAVSIAYFAMRYYALGFVLNDRNYTSYPFSSVILTIPLVIWKYIGLLLWPADLSLFHQTLLVDSPLDLRFALPTLGLIGLLIGSWRLRGSPVALFALLWFGIHLLPVLNLTALTQEFLVQERYVYLPSIGFSLLAAMVIVKLPLKWLSPLGSPRTARIAVTATLLMLLGVRTLAQNAVWKDDMTLWSRGAEIAPDQRMSHFILGHKYLNLQRWDKVIESLENFMKLDQKNVVVISNLAAAHLFVWEQTKDRAHVDRAIALCKQGLNIRDDVAPVWDSLGRAYTLDTELRNYETARYYFGRALKLQPVNAMVNFHMGAVFLNENKIDNALSYLELARQQEPNLPDVHKFLGYAYRARGRNQEAIDSFNIYLVLKKPDGPEKASINQDIEKLRAQMQNAPPQS